MEIEQDLNLFGFSINNHQLRRDQHPPQPSMQDQEPHQPSTALSLSIQQPSSTDGPVKPKVKKTRLPPPEPQYLPFRYRKFLLKKGVDDNTLKLIYTRTLHTSDMNPHYARLSIPCNQVREAFLDDEEAALVRQSYRDGAKKKLRRKQLQVTVVDPSYGFRQMNLTKWNVDSEKSWWYALTRDWNKLAKENGLAVGVAIQLWSYRFPNGSLGFLIQKLDI